MKKFNYLFLFFTFIDSEVSNNEIIGTLKKNRLKYRQALTLLKKAYKILLELELDLTVDSSDFFKALEYFELRQYHKCIPIFKTLIKNDKCKLESMFLLAESFVALKKIDEACILYNTITNSTPDFLDEKTINIIKYSYLQLINYLGLNGEKKDIIVIIKRYIKKFPKERTNPKVELLCRNYNCSTILIDDEENNNSSDIEEDFDSVILKNKN